jgi:hypothetical protein
MAAALARAKARLEAERHDAARAYTPRGAAAEALATTVPEFVLSGPAGTGKSRALLEKLHACARRWPGMRGLIVRKTRVSLTESGLVTYERHVLGEDNPICAGMQRSNRALYTYPNKSEIVVGGIDRPGRIMSTEFDLIVVLEATELDVDDWEALNSRLRNGVMPWQQMIGDCNPDRPDHWLKKRAEAGAVVMRESKHEDNPILWDGQDWTERGAAYMARLDALTGVRYQRLRLGIWAGAEGAVYALWGPAHLVNADDLTGWLYDGDGRLTAKRVVAGVDWGYTNPGVIQVWAVDGDGRMVLLREVYRTGQTIDWWVQQAQALRREFGIETFACDPSEPAFIAAFNRAGLRAVRAINAIAPGIQAVQQRLKPAGDGRPRLFALRDCNPAPDPALVENKKPRGVADEIRGYVWAKGADGKPSKEQPAPGDDHALDALRYAVMHVDGVKPARVRRNPIYGD